MGQGQRTKGTCKVLTGGNPKEIVMTVSPMRGVTGLKPVASKAPPAPVAAKPAAANDPFKTIQQAQFVFTAELKKVHAGPTMRSTPPIYTHKLVLVVKEPLRGDMKPDSETTIGHIARQKQRPTFPVGEICLVTSSTSRGSTRIGLIRKADDALMKIARKAASLPLGWSKKDDKFVSPWADLGAGAWPKPAEPYKGVTVCRVTGRPALLTGAGVSMKVEKVPPKKEIIGTNRDGDGSYTITITNDTDKPITVPALLSDDKGILWDESLVILCQNKARPIPGAKGLETASKSTVLKPKQAVSTVVNALGMKNVQWPRGGYRIEFQFCLGELSVIKSFYYMSRYHDKIRQGAAAKLKK